MRAPVIGIVALGLSVMFWDVRPAQAQAQCPISYGTADSAKPNKLYLYFPTADDATFPSYATNVSPARTFDISLLTSYTGTAGELRDRVRDVVIDDYCEFNVQVLSTTTAPPTTFARRNVVAIGTDANGTTWGQAQAVDVADPTAADFARVWAGTYQSTAGGMGGALNGANSTVQRWGFSIGGTAAHEAGHNYGLAHSDGANMTTGEGAVGRSIMPQGSVVTDEERAGFRRFFNDVTFGILAANVGLSVQTMHNWDLVNPNSTAASRLRMEFLSSQPSMTMTWSYAGNLSPWVNPTVSNSLGTQTFQGNTLNRFQITWSTGQMWNAGSAGSVPAGVAFHIGATFSGVDFNQPNPIIITNIELLDGSGNPLTLHPRMVGYDSGNLDASDGTFSIRLFNNDRDARPLIVTDLRVHELPRVLSIDSMVPGAAMTDWRGGPIVPWTAQREPRAPGVLVAERLEIRNGQPVSLRLSKLTNDRHVFVNADGKGCKPPNDQQDKKDPPDVNECVNGTYIGLFPSTTMYLTGTVVDPNAQHWDVASGQMVTGPVESKLFYQFGGITPDLNRNGIDDYIDIFKGTSRDTNRDGVPDEAQAKPRWWLWLIIVLLAVGLVYWYARHRSKTAPA
jgi:Peptidase M66